MAESINRVVPPSVSLDRAPALGRERERKKSGDEHNKTTEERNESPAGPNPTEDAVTPTDADKGNHVDIKA